MPIYKGFEFTGKDKDTRIKCGNCGEAELTLFRVKDADGNKMKPAVYRCEVCNRVLRDEELTRGTE